MTRRWIGLALPFAVAAFLAGMWFATGDASALKAGGAFALFGGFILWRARKVVGEDDA